MLEKEKNPVEGSYTNKLLSDKTLSKSKVLEEIDELIEAVEKELDLIAQYDDQLEMMNKYFSDEDDTKLLKE